MDRWLGVAARAVYAVLRRVSIRGTMFQRAAPRIAMDQSHRERALWMMFQPEARFGATDQACVRLVHTPCAANRAPCRRPNEAPLRRPAARNVARASAQGGPAGPPRPGRGYFTPTAPIAKWGGDLPARGNGQGGHVVISVSGHPVGMCSGCSVGGQVARLRAGREDNPDQGEDCI